MVRLQSRSHDLGYRVLASSLTLSSEAERLLYTEDVGISKLSVSTNIGELSEWFKEAVLKTVDLKGSGSSNLSLSEFSTLTHG